MARDPVQQVLASYPVVHQALRQPAGRGEGKLSQHQSVILSHLDRSEPLILSDLAALMRVALPTMSLLINRLAGQGLVRRDRDVADRRRVLVRLTSAGDRALSNHSLLDPNRVRALLALLSPAERAAGVDGLAALARAARRLARVDSEFTGRNRGSP